MRGNWLQLMCGKRGKANRKGPYYFNTQTEVSGFVHGWTRCFRVVISVFSHKRPGKFVTFPIVTVSVRVRAEGSQAIPRLAPGPC